MICHISIYRSINRLIYPNRPLKNIQAMKATLFLLLLYIGQSRAYVEHGPVGACRFVFSNGKDEYSSPVSLIRPFKA